MTHEYLYFILCPPIVHVALEKDYGVLRNGLEGIYFVGWARIEVLSLGRLRFCLLLRTLLRGYTPNRLN